MTAMLVTLPVLIFSIVLHEVAHGLAALYFGDDTAKNEGRLTLNPIAHLDLFGSIILPALCLILHAPVFAWAKPVPFNTYNLRPERLGTLCVTLAGIAANLAIAIVAGLGIRLLMKFSPAGAFSEAILSLLGSLVYLNLLLAIFNLLPIPPLDGWRLWGVWIPAELRMRIESNAMIGFMLLIVLVQFLPISMLVSWAFNLLVGLPL